MNYEFTGETKTVYGVTLHRIRATKDIPRLGVMSGDVGGWIERESNLSDDAWVSGNAQVYGRAQVFGDARVYGVARVYGDAQVYGRAQVSCDATIKSSYDYSVFRNSWSSGRWFTYTKSNKMWRVGCFYGTGDELIEKAYADSEESGKCYEAIVRAKEMIDNMTTTNRERE